MLPTLPALSPQLVTSYSSSSYTKRRADIVAVRREKLCVCDALNRWR